jgi:hypothetical protein
LGAPAATSGTVYHFSVSMNEMEEQYSSSARSHAGYGIGVSDGLEDTSDSASDYPEGDSDSDCFSDGLEDLSDSGSDDPDSMAPNRPPLRHLTARITTSGNVWQVDRAVWDLTSAREYRDQPIIEIRLLLNQWSKKKIDPTPSMKLAYKRLRDAHDWMELPSNPPCILLPYQVEDENHAVSSTWQYTRRGRGPLKHGFIQCYNQHSVCAEEESVTVPKTLYLKDAGETIQNNRLFMILALHLNPQSLRWAGDNVLDCLQIVTYAIRKDPFCLEYVPTSLKKNREFVMDACSVNPGAIEHAHISLQGDRNFVRPLLAKEGQLLKCLPASIKDDAELVTIAIQQCTYAIRYASIRLRENKTFVRSAVMNDWETIMYVSDRMRNDKQIAEIAVGQHSDAIEYCGNKVLRKNPQIMNLAIATSEGTCAFYDYIFTRLSKAQIIYALTFQPSSYENLPDNLMKDKEVVTTVLREDWRLMRMMDGKVVLSLENMYTIIQHDDWYYVPAKWEPAIECELRLPWSFYNDNLSLFIEAIKKDRRVISRASFKLRGHPRIVYEAMKCYEDIGKGMIDPLKTAPYNWCNVYYLAKNLAIMRDDRRPSKLKLRNKLLPDFLSRFSTAHLSESIGISRVYRI